MLCPKNHHVVGRMECKMGLDLRCPFTTRDNQYNKGQASGSNPVKTHKEPGQRQVITITESQTERGISIAIQHFGWNMAQSEGRTGKGAEVWGLICLKTASWWSHQNGYTCVKVRSNAGSIHFILWFPLPVQAKHIQAEVFQKLTPGTRRHGQPDNPCLGCGPQQKCCSFLKNTDPCQNIKWFTSVSGNLEM